MQDIAFLVRWNACEKFCYNVYTIFFKTKKSYYFAKTHTVIHCKIIGIYLFYTFYIKIIKNAYRDAYTNFW